MAGRVTSNILRKMCNLVAVLSSVHFQKLVPNVNICKALNLH